MDDSSVKTEVVKENELYSVILEAVNDGLWEWNVPTGKAFFNPGYYRMLGYEDKEFSADYDTWKKLVHTEDIARVEEELQRSVSSAEKFNIDMRMKTKSGDWLWVSTRGRVIEKSPEGKAVRMVGTLTDISDKVKLEEKIKDEKAKYEAIVTSSQDGIVMMDNQGNITSWNPGAERMFGYSEPEVLGKNLHDLITVKEEHRTKKDNLNTFFATGQSPVMGKIIELPVKNRQGQELIIELSVSAAKLGGKWFGVGVMRDTTERKKIEELKNKAIKELESTNSMMVDRELKMVELKKTIAQLQMKS